MKTDEDEAERGQNQGVTRAFSVHRLPSRPFLSTMTCLLLLLLLLLRLILSTGHCSPITRYAVHGTRYTVRCTLHTAHGNQPEEHARREEKRGECAQAAAAAAAGATTACLRAILIIL